MKTLIALLFIASSAQAQTSVVEWWLDNNPAKVYSTQAKCDAAAIALNVTKAYQCPRVVRVTAKTVPVPPVATWTYLGGEDDLKAIPVPPNSTVRYGKEPTWVIKITDGPVYCWNGWFGGDPLPTIAKTCELKTGTVTPPTTGSATVTWTAPTTNADGTPLADLAGYRVQYGPTTGLYTTSVNTNATTAVIPNLSAGRWFFAVRAVDTQGAESSLSAEVSKTIP